MAKDDDDLIKNNGPDFDANSDDEDFVIPNDPTDDSSEGDFDDSLGFGEEYGNDDALSLEFNEDLPTLEMDSGDNSGDNQDEPGNGPDSEGNEEFKLGWKSYTGLALAAVMTVGGLSYYMFPADAVNSVQTQQASDATREMIRQRANESIQNANRQERAPVELQAFPVKQVPVQPPVDEVQLQAVLNRGTTEEFPAVPVAGSSQYLPATDFTLPVRQVAPNNGATSDLIEMRQLPEFQALAQLVTTHTSDIGGLKNDTGEQEDTINALELRVVALEEKLGQLLIEQKEEAIKKIPVKTVKAQKQAEQKVSISKPKESSKPSQTADPVAYSAKVPGTPAELKALQRQLAIYGYKPGLVDGVMGQNTRGAIKRLQREHGLPETGWLNRETLLSLVEPKHYSGVYAEKQPITFADHPRDEDQYVATWYVRGVTPDKAVVFRLDGMSYAVSVGTEVPGMGQVTALDPGNHQVKTVRGTINKR